MKTPFPFSAIVGQDEMKLAMLIVSIDPNVGGVLVMGDRGTGKSTAARALAALLPPIKVMEVCAFNCDPESPAKWCEACQRNQVDLKKGAKESAKALAHHSIPVPFVDLPLGATQDRLLGSLDLEAALSQGIKRFEPGLLARAHRGFLYVDEVNLLEDALVDLLIDVAASGENLVEREGLSIRHAAKFVLVGSGNPEEGELRPQLLDRFGLNVDVRTPQDLATRIEIVRRRDQFELNPQAFCASWSKEEQKLRRRILAARKLLPQIEVPQASLMWAAQLCQELGTDGLRAELTLMRAARCVAALEGKVLVTTEHMRKVAVLALRHRLRRDPLDESDASERVERAVQAHQVAA